MDTFNLILYISNVSRSPAVSKHQSYMFFLFLHFNIRLQIVLSALNYLIQLLSPLNRLSFTLTSTGFYLTAENHLCG